MSDSYSQEEVIAAFKRLNQKNLTKEKQSLSTNDIVTLIADLEGANKDLTSKAFNIISDIKRKREENKANKFYFIYMPSLVFLIAISQLIGLTMFYEHISAYDITLYILGIYITYTICKLFEYPSDFIDGPEAGAYICATFWPFIIIYHFLKIPALLLHIIGKKMLITKET